MSISDGSIQYTVKTNASLDDVSNSLNDFKNKLGYRQKNKTYAIGDIAYHSALPIGWYLECTTAGTSGSDDFTITNPAVGNTATDGTIVWRIGMPLSLNGGKVSTGNIITSADNSWIRIMCGDSATDSPAIFFNGNDGTGSVNKGIITLSAMNKTANTSATLSIHPTNGLMYQNWEGYPADLGGSAIIAKSLSTNGYIKYASGLIMQWGLVKLLEETIWYEVRYPVSFPYDKIVTVSGCNCLPEITDITNNGFKTRRRTGDGYSASFAEYIVIGM